MSGHEPQEELEDPPLTLDEVQRLLEDEEVLKDLEDELQSTIDSLIPKWVTKVRLEDPKLLSRPHTTRYSYPMLMSFSLHLS